jgi:hypothetical protein
MRNCIARSDTRGRKRYRQALLRPFSSNKMEMDPANQLLGNVQTMGPERRIQCKFGIRKSSAMSRSRICLRFLVGNEFRGRSLLLSPMCLFPDVVWKINDDRARCAANHYPTKRYGMGGINLPVHKPSRYMDKVAGTYCSSMLSAVPPLHQRFTLKHIHDRLLRSVMMYSRLCSRFDEKRTGPQTRGDALFGGDRCKPPRPRGL